MNENEYVDINAHDNYPDSEQKIEIPTMKVLPLKKICMTIGELPTSYLETMTYYEMLVWFIEYLKNNIIPTVNNNAEAVQEVQSVVLELQNYINDYKDSIDQDVEELEEYMNNYFENLDVQEEINNKLDQMLEDGVLEQIIEQFIQSNALWCFDTVNDMKSATNLINGSFAKTLGFHSLNDGGNAVYKIRTINNDDVIDEIFIISLNDDSLIAELIYSSILNIKQIGAYGDNTHDDYNVINQAINKAKNSIINTLYLPSGRYKLSTNLVINYPINIKGDYSEYTGSYTNENLGTIIVDNYDGNDPFIKYIDSVNVYPNNRIWGIKINDIQIIGNNKNHIGLYLNKTGWNGLIQNVYIRDFNNTGLFLDKVFDTKFDNVQIIECGSKNSTDANYSLVLDDTENTDSSNGLHFDSLHIEGTRYALKLNRSKNNTFSNCKFENRINVEETDVTNSEIVLTNNALEHSFIGCQFIGIGSSAWLEKSISIENVPYMIDILFTSNRTKAIIIDSCQFSSPNDKGTKFIKAENLTQINNCSFRTCCNKYYTIYLKNSILSNSNFLLSNSESNISEVSIIRSYDNNLINNCQFNYYESQNIPNKYAIDFGTNISSVSNCYFNGFTGNYTYDDQSSINFNNSYLQRNTGFINLTDTYYKNLMGLESIDFNNITLDVSKFTNKLIVINFSENATIKTLSNGLNGDEITFLNNTGNTYTIGGDFDYYGTKIRGSQSSATITIGSMGSCKIVKFTNYWKVTSVN